MSVALLIGSCVGLLYLGYKGHNDNPYHDYRRFNARNAAHAAILSLIAHLVAFFIHANIWVITSVLMLMTLLLKAWFPSQLGTLFPLLASADEDVSNTFVVIFGGGFAVCYFGEYIDFMSLLLIVVGSLSLHAVRVSLCGVSYDDTYPHAFMLVLFLIKAGQLACVSFVPAVVSSTWIAELLAAAIVLIVTIKAQILEPVFGPDWDPETTARQLKQQQELLLLKQQGEKQDEKDLSHMSIPQLRQYIGENAELPDSVELLRAFLERVHGNDAISPCKLEPSDIQAYMLSHVRLLLATSPVALGNKIMLVQKQFPGKAPGLAAELLTVNALAHAWNVRNGKENDALITQHEHDKKKMDSAERWYVPPYTCDLLSCNLTTELKKCARCESVEYCSKEHQVSDWKQHKPFCAKQLKLNLLLNTMEGQAKDETAFKCIDAVLNDKSLPSAINLHRSGGAYRGYTALMTAASHRHTAIKKLLEAKANVNAVHPATLKTALHLAVTNMRERDASRCAVFDLLEAKADVNARDVNHSTALHDAAELNMISCLKLLIDGHADVNICDLTGHAPITRATLKGHVEVLQTLVHANADVNQAITSDGFLQVHFATRYGQALSLGALLNSKADINAVNKDGVSALFLAAECNQLTCLNLLLASRADMNGGAYGNVTPLYIATQKNNSQCLQALVKAGADVNCVSNESITPLILAAHKNHVDCASILLEAKANVATMDKDGKTALNHAQEQDLVDMVAILEGKTDLIRIKKRRKKRKRKQVPCQCKMCMPTLTHDIVKS